MPKSDLWLRRWQIVLTQKDGKGITIESSELDDDFRCTFVTQAPYMATLPTAIITIYNLSDASAKGLIKEFDQVTLSAGYRDGRYGQIFRGQIKQYERGHEENMTETFLRIYATDQDVSRYAITNKSLEAGSTEEIRRQAAQAGFKLKGIPEGYQEPVGSPLVLYRGAVLHGMGADPIRNEGENSGSEWNIVDGKYVLTYHAGYQPGQIVELNSQTGLVTHPTITDNGIQVTSLLNPNFRVKGLVHLNNDEINWTGAPGGSNVTYWPDARSFNLYEMLSSDGVYIILVKTHEGDTRGNPWYTHLTCVARDPSKDAAFAGVDPRRAARTFGG